MENAQTERRETLERLDSFRFGRDELNLAEFPLASISDRFLDGTKTIISEDTVWDDAKRKRVPRKLAISGSDRFGLPTAKDDDVLLACVQLSSIGDFHSRRVNFSRYELLKLLRWPDETRYYRRLAMSLRRWLGVAIYSDKAFFDKARQSWVNRDFGIFDNLNVYEREEEERAGAPASSFFVWNEVIFESFQSGYLKQLDWDMYLGLESPVAKRLYRFLDKRFYHQGTLTFDLHELAFNKIRMSRNYNTAQIKRALLVGVNELEDKWELRRVAPEKRFQKLSRGRWEVVFHKRKRRAEAAVVSNVPRGLEIELTKRGVGPSVAYDLVSDHSHERIKKMVALFDFHNGRGEERGPGFLVAGIKSKEPYKPPRGFGSERKNAKRPERKLWKETKREQEKGRPKRQGTASEKKFVEFWKSLSEPEKATFEEEALLAAERTKFDGYERLRQVGGPLFEAYRLSILREFLETRREEESV